MTDQQPASVRPAWKMADAKARAELCVSLFDNGVGYSFSGVELVAVLEKAVALGIVIPPLSEDEVKAIDAAVNHYSFAHHPAAKHLRALLARLGGSIPQSWSEQLCALDFGDVTTRKRWFYSDHLLHVVRTPGPRRLRDIRDHEADRIALDKSAQVAAKKAKWEARLGRTYNMPPRTDDDAIGSLGATSYDNLQSGSTLIAVQDDGALGSLRASSHYLSTNQTPDRSKKRGVAHLVELPGYVADDEVLGSLTQSSFHGSKNNGSGEPTKGSMVALPHQSRPTRDDELLGTLTAGKGGSSGFLAIELSARRTRCPSLLEMARAHSIPDSWDWASATKTQRGLLIANSWPIGMGTAVLAAMLRAVAVSREAVA